MRGGKGHEAKDSAEDERDHLFDLALDLLCIAHTSGCLRRVNPSFTRVLGWSAEELTAKPLLDFIHPDDRPASQRALEKLAGGESVVEFENRFCCKDGTWRVLSWKGLPRPDGIIYATAHDVTGERMERQFHEQREKFQTALLALRDYEGNDVPASFRHATTLIAEAMQVERVSVWLFDEARTAIVCEDLVHRSTGEHEQGVRLTAADFPHYFEAATKRKPIVADDAHTHPDTCEFSACYLTPLGITSMLDVPLIKDGSLHGVVCHEHTGPMRQWTPQEVEFAASASGYVTLTLERSRRRAAEAEVRASEAHLHRVIEASGLGCWEWNVLTNDVTYSGDWAKMLGYDADEVLPGWERWESLIHPDDKEGTLSALTDHLEGRSPVYSREFRLRTRDGQWRWILSQGRVATRDAEGRAVHVSGIHKDIHEHRLAQDALRELNITLERRIALRTAALQESEERFRQLAEGIDTVFWMADTELEVITYVSTAYEKIWGRSISDLASDPRPFAIAIHPGDRERVIARIAEARRKRGEPFEIEYRIVRPDGSVRFIRDRGFPIRDHEGTLMRIVGIADDITIRVEAVRNIRQALATLDATEDGAFIFDPVSLRFSYVNQGAMQQLGYSREELLAMTPLDIAPEFTEASLRSMLRPLQSGEMATHHYTTRHRRKDGRDLPVETSLQYITPPGEEPRCIAIVRDITERLRMEQRTNRSQRLEAIGTLAGGVAHDLNNALAPILMGVEGLRRRHPEEIQILDTFETSANRGAGMVRQLLTFAKGAEGEYVSIQSLHLIRELQEILRGTFPKNLELQIICEPGLPIVLGDATQLHQILLNLCVNARDAMPQGGALTVEARRMEMDAVYASSLPEARPGTYLMLQVRDTGTGIAPEIMDRIFDPFFTTKAPNKGTGLGLSTVMGLVKSHGGFLQVQSREGTGTTFTVYIPAETATDGVQPGCTKGESFTGMGETILLVDDEAAILGVGSLVLTDLKFHVVTAADGVEGLLKATEHRDRLCAVITDQHMPHMDGLSFVRALRRMLPNLPVAVGSGRLDDAIAAQYKALDVVRLDKPYSQDKLVGALKTMLDGDDARFSHHGAMI
jgi:PAS domain S-box-containing protein